MNLDNDAFVTPGEKIGTEEEFASGRNTYVEDGVIYSSVAGKITKEEGAVGVRPLGREIILIGKDMLVMGVVTDDMKSVMFVKIDNVNIDRKDYLALKDGKIVAPRPRPPRFGDRGGGDRFGGRDNKFGAPKSEKPCGIGDTIIARVLYNDKDSYTLSVMGRETGVIYAKCELCGGEMDQKGENLLVCRECAHRENRKLSEFYNKPQDIKKLFA
jgi:exosome complex component CSL4